MKHGDTKETFGTGAQRDTQDGKPLPGLLSPYAAERKAWIMAKGAGHYGPRNWEKGMNFSRVVESLERHLLAFKQGVIDDDDHLAQLAWNADALLHFDECVKRGILPVSLDDMPHYELRKFTATPDAAWMTNGEMEELRQAIQDELNLDDDEQAAQDYANEPSKAYKPSHGGHPQYQAVGEENACGQRAMMAVPEDDDGPRGAGSSDTAYDTVTPYGEGTFVMPSGYNWHEQPKSWSYEANQTAPTGRPDQVYWLLRIREAIFERLLKDGCATDVAKQVIAGLSIPENFQTNRIYPLAYIAGPMRGYDKFNFPLFDSCRDHLLRNGYMVISPADIDRGSDSPDTQADPEYAKDQTRFVLRDFWSLFFLKKNDSDPNYTNAIVLLDGWERSKGAAGEAFLARWLGLTPFRYSENFGEDIRHLSEQAWDEVCWSFAGEYNG